MPRQLVPVLLLAFLAVIGVNWPPLPFNASVADVIFTVLAIAVVATPMPKLTWHRADLAVAIYLLGSLPAIAISADHRGSLIEFARELYLVAIYIVIAIAARRGLVDTIARGLIFGGLLLSSIAMFFAVAFIFGMTLWPPVGEVMTLPYVGSVMRIRALTASEAMFACLMTAIVPFTIRATRSGRVSWLKLFLMTAAAAFTLSHALAGLTVAIVIALWPTLSAWPRRAAVAAAAVVVLGLNFAATASITSISNGSTNYADASQYHYAVDQQELTFGSIHVTYNVMSYARIKQVAWQAFVDHPIAGVGLDQFHQESERAFQEGRLTSDYRAIDPHSTLPGRFSETGLIGGIALLFLWFEWSRLAIAAAKASPTIGLAAAAALAGLAVSSINADIMNFRFLWVIVGVLRGLQDANGISIAAGRAAGETAARD